METKNKDTAIAGQQKTVSITRTFDLPVEKVWKAWTEPESIKKWWGPKDYTCPHATLDVKPGGKYVACMKATDGKEFWSTGVYKEIIPLKKLVCTDSFADNKGNKVLASYYNIPGEWPDELLITVTFEAVGGKTKMTLRQEDIPEEAYDDCIKGWQESFDKLESRLNR